MRVAFSPSNVSPQRRKTRDTGATAAPRGEETSAREEKTHFCFFEAATLISVEPKQVLSDDLLFFF